MSYTLLRWYREGISATLDAGVIDQPPKGARATLAVDVEISATGIANSSARAQIEVLGPGDVNGLDHRQIIRTFPVAGTLDFEPDYFAHVELKRPDLPWLFTPLAPVTALDSTPAGWTRTPYRRQHTVPPWLCLAVIPKRDGVSLEPGTPLPRLKIASGAGAELPLLEETHAWAHVQVSGDLAGGVANIAATQPERILSRLVCPRRLEPATSYLACLVPAFKSGREAGLGLNITATSPAMPAWSALDAQVELPVYFHWEFATGGSGDFESLVRRLESRGAAPGVGTRALDITRPRFGMNDRASTTKVALGGALRTSAADPAPIDGDFARTLPAIVNTVDAVAPPIYGRWHAAVDKVKAPGAAPGWLDALNLDPRYRVAAGLGTQIVQERQEDLMTAIWEQFGEILRANQLLRQAQLAVAAAERVVARHLSPLGDLELLSIAGAALARVRVGDKRSARKAVRESCLPLIALSGAFRRIARARGPLERRYARVARTALSDARALVPPALSTPSILQALASGQNRLAPAALPAGAIAIPFDINPPKRPLPRVVTPLLIGVPPPIAPPSVPADVRAAVAALQLRVRSGACTPLDSAALADTVRAALAPDVAVTARLRAQLKLPAGVAVSARLDPIMVAPEIPTPMIGPLQELGQDWLLPGLSELPTNSITIVEPDPAFIEAYMVGLNHEMSRELLWRGFPTDQRGTVFSQFWDRRGSVSTTTARVPLRDIKPIHTWKAKSALGANLTAEGKALLVLLLRGDLLQRYPKATIYMQRARWKRNPQGAIEKDANLALREPVPVAATPSAWATNTRFPSFTGRLGADVTFLGFPLSNNEVRGRSRENVPDTASGDPGWFVVFQEQPTAPRFGLKESGVTPVKSWDQLSWSKFVTTTTRVGPAGALVPSGYIKVAETSTTHRPAELPAQPVWDGRSESLAAILLKRSFRLFVHASDLVAES